MSANSERIGPGRGISESRGYDFDMRRKPMMLVILAGYFLFKYSNGNIVPLVALGLVAVVGVLAYRAYESRQQRIRADQVERADVAAGTELVTAKLADTANRILAVEARPGLDMSPEAGEYFQKAVSTFVSVDERFPAARSRYELEALVSQLDDALWQLDAAQAIINDEAIPTRSRDPMSARRKRGASGLLSGLTRDAVAKWGDGGSGGTHGRRKRPC